MKIGPVKVQLHAGEVLRLCNGRANWTFCHFELHVKFDRNLIQSWKLAVFFTEPLCIKMRKMGPTGL